MIQAPALSSAREREIRGALQRRKTPAGDLWLVVIGQALAELSHNATEADIETARHFLLNAESPIAELCELLAVDHERLRRKAFHRSVRVEAMRAELAARNRQRSRERRRLA